MQALCNRVVACVLLGGSAAVLAASDGSELSAVVVNALLVPLLEPEEGPLIWASPNELTPCPDSATVRVDGRPLPAGQPVPIGRPFVLQWRLNDCWPLGAFRMGLSGTLDMTVLHEGTRLAVRVRPRDLAVAANGMQVLAWREFDATLSLVSGKSRP